MYAIKSDSAGTFYIFDIVINKERTGGIDAISFEQDLIEFRKGFTGFFNSGHHDAFEPVKEGEILKCPWECLRTPVCKRVKFVGTGSFDFFQDIYSFLYRTFDGFLPSFTP